MATSNRYLSGIECWMKAWGTYGQLGTEAKAGTRWRGNTQATEGESRGGKTKPQRTVAHVKPGTAIVKDDHDVPVVTLDEVCSKKALVLTS
jgi:hypothetical protein